MSFSVDYICKTDRNMYKRNITKPIPKKKVNMLLMEDTVLATEFYNYANFNEKYFHYTLQEKENLF